MIRRDAAVDDADDDVLAAQPEIGAQAADGILQAEERRRCCSCCRYWSVSCQMRSTSALCASRETCAAVRRAAKPLTE